MANKKHPDRDKFEAELEELNKLDVPADYATIVRHTRPDIPKRLLYDVRHGNTTDLAVLAEIRRVTRERAAANIIYAQTAVAA